ncbi:MAG: hypothetical protein Q4B26_17025, partial [Eubacteriales bacterium]|nr:hypothetical protein [Eubacteriales bacterium]
ASGNMRYTLFLITPSSLMDFLESEIPEGAVISALSNGDVSLFGEFVVDEDENLLSKTGLSMNGLRVQLSMDKTLVQQNLEDITAHSLYITAINMLLCVILIVVVVFINYRPLAKIVKSIRSDKPNTSLTEIETLVSHFTSLEQKNETLSLELYEKRMMITDRILENLLSGKKVPISDIKSIQLKLPYYRVICLPLDRIKNVSNVITNNLENPTIYSIEMYADKLLAIICGQAGTDEESLNYTLHNIRKLLQDNSIPLGISTAFPSHSLSSLYVAYHQASRAL